MGKYIKWATLAASLCCLVFIFIFYADSPRLIFQFNDKNLRGILLAIGMIVLIYKIASSLLRPGHARINSENTHADSASGRERRPIALPGEAANPIKAALRKNPALTVIFILFGISLPILFELAAPRPGGRQFTSDDWTPIVVGETLVAIVFLVTWYLVRNRTRKKKVVHRIDG